jgi:hypothetical protein
VCHKDDTKNGNRKVEGRTKRTEKGTGRSQNVIGQIYYRDGKNEMKDLKSITEVCFLNLKNNSTEYRPTLTL